MRTIFILGLVFLPSCIANAPEGPPSLPPGCSISDNGYEQTTTCDGTVEDVKQCQDQVWIVWGGETNRTQLKNEKPNVKLQTCHREEVQAAVARGALWDNWDEVCWQGAGESSGPDRIMVWSEADAGTGICSTPGTGIFAPGDVNVICSGLKTCNLSVISSVHKLKSLGSL